MHELSLCRSVFAVVDRARAGREVQTVHLQVGQLRQVVPDTLVYCWDLVVDGTVLEGSHLEIEHIPVRLRCTDCGAATTAADRLLLVCGQCGGGRVTVTTGEEFIVTTMDLRTDSREREHGQISPA